MCCSSAHPGTSHCPWGAELASRTPLVERVRSTPESGLQLYGLPAAGALRRVPGRPR